MGLSDPHSRGNRGTVRLGSGSPDPEAVRAQVEKIIASTSFGHSERLGRFLRLIVSTALAAGAELNEYSIAVKAFDKSPDFDPRIDPTVRVHASRLRSKLTHYYSTEGKEDSILIDVPTRTYKPLIRKRTSELPASGDPRRSTKHGTAVVNSLAVVPFVALGPEPGDEPFADGLTRELTHRLSKLDAFRVVVFSTAENGSAHINAEIQEFSVIFEGSTRRVGDQLRISAMLLDGGDRTVLWSEMYEGKLDDVIPTQEKLAVAIANDVGPLLESRCKVNERS